MILKQILIDDIKINFKKSNRAKNISIRIKSKDGVTVIIPRLSSIKTAEKFVHQKLNWIKKHYEKIQKSLASNTVFDTNTNYSTKFHLVKITLSSNMFSFNMTNEVVNINFTLKTMLHSEEVQNKIQTLIIDVYRYEAKKYLPKQTQLLANRTNLKFQNISVRNTKTRWGSCSYNNNISLSLHLMRLPNHLIDYVIFHGLAHTLVKNHSHEFWNTLESLCPDSKKLDKELKNYDLEIF